MIPSVFTRPARSAAMAAPNEADWELTNYGLDDNAIAELRRRFEGWPR